MVEKTELKTKLTQDMNQGLEYLKRMLKSHRVYQVSKVALAVLKAGNSFTTNLTTYEEIVGDDDFLR